MTAKTSRVRVIRAPETATDRLDHQQVKRYLSRLRKDSIALLEPEQLSAPASTAWVTHATGSELLHAGPALVNAVLSTLAYTPEDLRNSLAYELEDPKAIVHVLTAFDCEDGSIRRSELEQFTRFCVAYRVHCYFETSCLERLPSRTRSIGTSHNLEVVFVFGVGCTGKSKLCQRISTVFGYKHIQISKVLSKARDQPSSDTGRQIYQALQQGVPVASTVMAKLLQQSLACCSPADDRFVVDGFPRNLSDLEAWEAFGNGLPPVKLAILLEAPTGTLHDRAHDVDRQIDKDAEIAKSCHATTSDIAIAAAKLESQCILQRVSAEAMIEEVFIRTRRVFGPTCVFVLGGPGAGKSTQCSHIAQTFGYRHLSVKQLLQNEMRRPTSEHQNVIETCMRDGSLVPDHIVVSLLRQEMQRLGWAGRKYLVDGFPRSLGNLNTWRASVGDTALVRFCLFLECSEGIMEARAFESTGNDTDALPSIRKRFNTFYHESLPVVEQLKSEGLLRRIDAEQSTEAVKGCVRKLFGPSVLFMLADDGVDLHTQCAHISATFEYQHLCARDVVHDNYFMFPREGPGPGHHAAQALRRAMQSRGWEATKFVIQGFPSTVQDLEAWKEDVGHEVAHQSAIIMRTAADKPAEFSLESPVPQPLLALKDAAAVVQKLEEGGPVWHVNADQDAKDVWSNVKKLLGPSVIFMIGGPFSGKRTQCSRIAETFGYQHIRAGDLIREEVKRPGSQVKDQLEKCMSNGTLVAPEILIDLLHDAMHKYGWEGGHYILDGYPLSMGNWDVWMNHFGDEVSVPLALYLDCSETTMEARFNEYCKSMGAPGDGVDFLQRRFGHLRSELPALASHVEKHGLLRRIDAEQDYEQVWSCVREVLHLELDTHLQNHAMVTIKPNASTPDTDRFVRSFLASHGIAIEKAGAVPAAEVMEKGFFDAQYMQILRNASADPKDLKVTITGTARFAEVYGMSWADAVAAGRVLNAKDAIQAFATTTEELCATWMASTVVKLAPSMHVARIERKGPAIQQTLAFVVNGFAPHWRETFCHSSGTLRWFAVSFSPAVTPWKVFRKELLGSTNPATAPQESIRGQMYRYWKKLGLKECPDLVNNCVHASAGPLEGLREHQLWAGSSICDHPLGRSLLAAGVPQACLTAWLENPLVENWPIPGSQQTSGPIFVCTEEMDHSEFRKAAIQYTRSNTSGMQCWPVRVGWPAHRLKSPRPPADTGLLKVSKLKPSVITVLHFNDVYNVEPRKKEPVGGIARFVTRVRELKAEAVARGEPEAICLFSGDAFNPSLTSTVTMGKHMVPALNAVGINTACYGNHDFDFGVDELVNMAGDNNFPWLISNVVDRKTGEPLGEALFTRMVDWHGRKIGLMGLVEKEWLVSLHSIEPSDVTYEDFCPCGRRLAKQMREEGADVVIALTHMRVPNDELLAHEVPEIDIILGGHDHHYDVKPVGSHGTYVLKSGTDFRDITVLRLEFTDGKGPRPIKVLGHQHVEITSDIAEDPEMKSLVQECQSQVGASMDKVIGESAVDLDCRFSSIRTSETNIGNFITDVMRQGMKADIALINSGTLRADAIVEKGPIHVRDLLSILPMLDELCVLELSGSQVLQILQNGVSQYPRLEGRFLQVSGVSFSFDALAEPGHRVVVDTIQIGGEALQTDSRYKVCTLNFLRQGKDGFDCLKGAMCLADGEQAGILPTMVRDYFQSMAALNGLTATTTHRRLQKAHTLSHASRPMSRVGEGPAPLQQYAIHPQVEGRIKCLNPVGT